MQNLPPVTKPMVVGIDDGIYKNKHIRVLIVTRHEYVIQISDNGHEWRTIELFNSPNREFPVAIKPGMYKTVK